MVPSGILRNRATLEAFLQCGFEQGVGTFKLEVEEMSLEQVTKGSDGISNLNISGRLKLERDIVRLVCA